MRIVLIEILLFRLWTVVVFHYCIHTMVSFSISIFFLFNYPILFWWVILTGTFRTSVNVTCILGNYLYHFYEEYQKLLKKLVTFFFSQKMFLKIISKPILLRDMLNFLYFYLVKWELNFTVVNTLVSDFISGIQKQKKMSQLSMVSSFLVYC